MSGKLIATVGDTHTCPMVTGTTPHVGGTIISGSSKMLANNRPVARMGDKCICNGCGMIATIIQGDANVLVDGKPIAYLGCMTSHGGVITSGQVHAFLSGSKPPKLVTMPIDEIDFPDIATKDRVIATIAGHGAKLKEAETNIAQLKRNAKQQKEQKKDKEKKLPKLQGEIIFVNGYLSASLGGVMNAVFDIKPDNIKELKYSRGHNVDEHSKINDDDILTADELLAIINMTKNEIDIDRKNKALKIVYPTIKTKKVPVQFPVGTSPYSILPPINVPIPFVEKDTAYIDIPKDAKPIPYFTKTELKDTFYGYWNQVGNHHKASKIYAEYFNATGREHFINGSHGLGSNAAHRLDHGIALGYHWAKEGNWKIKTKKEIDAKKGDKPEIESYSPVYRPITIVMHSQGNAPGAGVALGVLKYAKEQGWEKAPINMIYLGVHQPKKLDGNDYKNFLKAKTKFYGVDNNFWNGAFWSPALKKDKQVLKFFNNLSQLFDPKYHKLHNKRGIYEHLKEITNFNALQKRSVQFTFSNDRGDLVAIDGDIPNIDSACRPKPDSTLYSVEFFTKKAPDNYKTQQGKEIIKIKEGGELVIPSHAAIPRIHAIEDPTAEGGMRKEFWNDYKSVASDWAKWFSTFKQLSKKHKLTWSDYLIPLKKEIHKLKTHIARKTMLYHYGRIQHADLYAHFSPVEFILDNDILKHDDFKDKLGQKSIWERIKKLGENKFYRVEYEKDANGNELNDKQKREAEKDYIIKNGQALLTDTSIADTPYIKNVIKAYVNGDEKAEKNLYKEPSLTDNKLESLQKMLGSDAKQKIQQDILQHILKKQDNTKLVIPKFKKL